jgi:hypothetical protein
VTFLAVFMFGWIEDVAAGRGLHLKLSPREWKWTRLTARPVGLAGSAVLSAGVVAVVLALFQVAQEPSSIIQPTAQTLRCRPEAPHADSQVRGVGAGAPDLR